MPLPLLIAVSAVLVIGAVWFLWARKVVGAKQPESTPPSQQPQ
jgi:hypothetical protein